MKNNKAVVTIIIAIMLSFILFMMRWGFIHLIGGYIVNIFGIEIAWTMSISFIFNCLISVIKCLFK